MYTTSVSLLERLHRPDEAEAWTRFVRLYTPLLMAWSRRLHLSDDDAADLAQDVLLALLSKLPSFTYDPHRTFRGWLKTVMLNKWRERARRRGSSMPLLDDRQLATLAAAAEDNWLEEAEYRQRLVGQALRIMQAEFEPTTWRACWEFVVSGRGAAEVAAELGVSVEVVYGAKCRVLRRLREELAGLIE